MPVSCFPSSFYPTKKISFCFFTPLLLSIETPRYLKKKLHIMKILLTDNCFLNQQRDSSYSRMESARESPMAPSFTPRNYYKPSGSKGYFPPDTMDQGGNQRYHPGSSGYMGPKGEASSIDASRTTTSSRDEPSISVSNASDVEAEWVEQDEPGVYITIRQLADGTRELRRVRFR
jgi:hypothetical protein